MAINKDEMAEITTVTSLDEMGVVIRLTTNSSLHSSKLYEAYRHFCQAIGRKPQSTNAFKKALDKLTGVYQSRTSSGMQWLGIKPVTQF